MSTKKVFPELTGFDGGLNTAGNPLTVKPNQWLSAKNVVVCKPYGFKTQQPEQEHIAQTRPPMALFVNSNFNVQVAGSPTEIKPLVGANQAAADSQPNQWQTIAKGISNESWTVTGESSAGNPDTLAFVNPGLTQSDGDNISLQIVSNGWDSTTLTKTLTTLLPNGPYTKGSIGNLNTMLYIDYKEMFRSHNNTSGIDTQIINSLVLRIGQDSNNYLEYNLPFGTLASPPPTFTQETYVGGGQTIVNSYGVYRNSVNVRSYNRKQGTLTFGQLISNFSFVQVVAGFPPPPNGILFDFARADHPLTIDHVRLDVDYNGFFGDFTVGQPYQQVTVDELDLNNPLSNATWVLTNGAYQERRLSIGNGCIAFEIDVANAPNAHAVATLSPAFNANQAGLPPVLMWDVRAENISSIGTITIKFGSDANNYYLISVPNVSGNSVSVVPNWTSSVVGAPNKSALSYLDLQVGAVNNPGTGTLAPRVYLNNLRFAPYTAAGNTAFPPQSGNIRDTYLYDPTDVGVSSRFLDSCGDALFLSNALLSAQSWYVAGGFTNWSIGSPLNGLLKRFQFTTAPNPNFIYSTTLATTVNAGAVSIVASSAVNLQANEQIVIDPTGVNPEINYVAASYTGGTTIPLKTPLAFGHAQGVSLTWENFAEPKTITLFVNGSDGLWYTKIITYPLGGGNTYQYPVVSKLYPEKFSTIVNHQGTVSLAGDPNNPNRIVFAQPANATVIPQGSFLELDISGNVTAGDRITALWSFEKFLITFRKTDIWVVYGDSVNNFNSERTSAFRGCLAPQLICQAARRLFYCSHDGVYEFANFSTQSISDNIKTLFQLNDQNIMATGFLFFNPLREMLILTLINGYNFDPLTSMTNNTTILTYSLEKDAWGQISWTKTSVSQTAVDPRYTLFSGVNYAGGTNPPACYFSSTTMVEMDNFPDTINDLVQIQTAFNYFASPFQTKTFDKTYIYASLGNGFINLAGQTTAVQYGTNLSGLLFLATGASQIATDAEGMLEYFCPSGTIGKAASLKIIGAYNSWVQPMFFQGYAVSCWPGEDL